ncbi:ADP-ribose pyrophosphatase YjhB, NUDIX family [Sphingomonas sp. NFR04]|uniref:NUDIX domain-containing protein n=1 Tax=Sphingomonas sp. NFR04 TaxID=1566283 RepID=UPI0008F141D5|nr:NUDIX domain-containing protein [Sphingomonas sp. NFR04]SFJ18397.1 ADP-ribose pyrophosphatase YjhB, NUDIX family [Sphingomonas sp. NFR04]
MASNRLHSNPVVASAITLALRSYLAVRTVGWFVTRPQTRGVRAIALTPAGQVILVRHSYIPGWHLPGGGQEAGETAEQAVLRELREEAGMVSHGAVRVLGTLQHRPNFRRDTVTIALVEQVSFAFRPSLEIVEARAFDLDALPADVTTGTVRRLAEWRERRPVATDW